MFRIAAGEELGYDDPEIRGHSIEYRINAEDGGRNFMPAPGTLTAGTPRPAPAYASTAATTRARPSPGPSTPSSPSSSSPAATAPRRSSAPAAPWTSSSSTACPPSSRSTAPWSRDPAYVGASTPTGDGEFTVYTQWIETEFDNQIEPYAGDAGEAEEAGERQKVTVEVGGRRLEVVLPAGLGGLGRRRCRTPAAPRRPKRSAKKAGAAASGDAVTSPMQGTIVKVVVDDGQEVAEGDTIVVMEAMKMEQPLKAHKAGTVTGLQAEVGATVTNGAVICEIKD